MQKRYQVALSFAGEDRSYVEKVAHCLRACGVRVFYDAYEEASLWGKDLYVHLRDVYQRSSAFTVMFISRHYSAKVWTSHERQSAQARAIAESREYILPVRFDDTEVPGLPATIGYIDVSTKSPEDLCALIVAKLEEAGLVEAAGRRHRLLDGDTASPEEASFLATVRNDGEFAVLKIAMTPGDHATVGELLDEMYSNYLSQYLEPYTYGQDWTLGRRHEHLLLPWQWVFQAPAPVYKLAPEWFALSPGQLGITAGSHWTIKGISDRVRGMTWESVGRNYFFGTDDKVIWDVVLNHPKAVALLLREGLIRKVALDASAAGAHHYSGVFRDWLGIGDQCAWVHTGDQLPPSLQRLLNGF